MELSSLFACSCNWLVDSLVNIFGLQFVFWFLVVKIGGVVVNSARETEEVGILKEYLFLTD